MTLKGEVLDSGHEILPRTALEEQQRVNAHFRATAEYWKRIYDRQDLLAVLYQRRRDLVLDMVDRLGLEPGSRVLDAGCGPGLITLGLARHGYTVEAMDATQAMIDSTRQLAVENGFESRVTARLGDVYRLPYPDNHFSAAMLIGVSDWLETLDVPMRELARVLAPGGYLIANADNSWALHHILDPVKNPLGAPVKRLIRKSMELAGLREPKAHGRLRSLRQFESPILAAGFRILGRKPQGFGPFSLFRHSCFPRWVDLKINDKLQRLADRGLPLVKSVAYTSIVLAKKP